MSKKEVLWTGQTASLHMHFDTVNAVVPCAKCKELVGLRDGSLDGATGLAWFDPYAGKKGKLVHYKCLSAKRMKELDK